MNAERDFLIREAQKNDLEAILAINNYVIQTSTSNYDWDIKELAWQKNWFQEKQIGNWPVFVVESEGRTVGFGTYGPFRLKQGYAKTVDEALANARKLNTPVKKIRVFDFDDTLARTKSIVFYTKPDGTEGQLTAEEFAEKGADLVAEGAVMDFSDFNIVL